MSTQCTTESQGTRVTGTQFGKPLCTSHTKNTRGTQVMHWTDIVSVAVDRLYESPARRFFPFGSFSRTTNIYQTNLHKHRFEITVHKTCRENKCKFLRMVGHYGISSPRFGLEGGLCPNLECFWPINK